MSRPAFKTGAGMKIKILMTALIVISLILSSCGKENNEEMKDTDIVTENNENTAEAGSIPASSENTSAETADTPKYGISPEWQSYLDTRLGEVPEGKSFIFIADTHWNDASLKETLSTDLMKYLSDSLGGAMVLHGGDLYNGNGDMTSTEKNSTKAIDASAASLKEYITDELYEKLGTKFLYTLGNHDTNIQGFVWNTRSKGLRLDDGSGTLEQFLDIAEKTFVSDETVYNETVGVIAKGLDIKFDEDGIKAISSIMKYSENSDGEATYSEEEIKQAEYLMRMHYHYDDPDNKIRYIVLDSGGCGYTQTFILGTTGYGTYTNMLAFQLNWLAKTLKSTPSDYDIVVLGHEIADHGTEYTYSDPVVNVYDILTAFKKGASVTTVSQIKDWGSTSAVGKELIEAFNENVDFERPYGGTLITLSGHTHSDNAWYGNNYADGTDLHVQFGSSEPAGDGAVLMISTGTAIANSVQGAKNVDGVSMGSEMPDNVRFDIVTIVGDGSVVLTRIGAGQSRSFAYGAK